MNEILHNRYQKYLQKKKEQAHSKSIAKFVFVGSGNVGKTSLVKVLKEKKYLFQFEEEDREYYRTPFIEIETIKFSDLSQAEQRDGSKREFLLCDIAGQTDLPIHAFQELSDFVLGSVDLIILVFSNDSMQSFLDLDDWITRVKDYYFVKDAEIPAFLLVKNKVDMKSAVDDSMVQMLIEHEEHVIDYLELSCLQGTNINEFKKFLLDIYQ